MVMFNEPLGLIHTLKISFSQNSRAKRVYIKHKSIKVKDAWIPNKTIAIQITMNYSEIDNKEMMAPKVHHIHRKLTSPSTGLPRRQGDSRGPRTHGLPGSPGTGPNRTGREPTAHQDQGLIMAHQDNMGPTQRQ